MNIDDIDTGTVQKIAQDLKNTRDKVNKINATTETVNNINRVDVDGDDFGNVAINSNTGRQRFDSNGLKTNDPDAPISINTNAKTGVVTVTVTRDTLEFVINTLRKVLEEPFVNIKLKGKRAKRFTKAQLEDVDGILKSFNTKKRIQDTTETLTIVNIEGEKVGFILNRKTGEPVAYKQDKTGQWIPENAVNSKKLLHAVMADDPVVKKEILETTKVRTDSETTKTDDSEPVDRQPTYDVRNEHKTKTHEQVADDLTGDGYKNITTVEQLNSLPETVGVRKREAKAGDNGQTKVKVKEYDENGNVITRDKDISLITKEMSEFKKTTTALDKAKAKLEQFALCNLQTGI
jgi:hypothetical protein